MGGDGEKTGVGDLADLLETEQRWRSIVENPFDFVVVIDRDYKYTFINFTAPDITEADLIGKATPFEFVDERHHAEMRAAFETTFRENRSASYEVYVPQLDQWFHSLVGPIRDGDDVVAASILTRDVTESKRAEVALEQSEQRLQMALEATHDGLFDMEVEGDAVYFSDQFYALLGYQPGDPALRLHWAEFSDRLHPDDAEEAAAALQSALQRNETFDSTYRMRCKDGSYRWFRGRGRVVEGARFTGLLSDVTAAKKAAAERERLEEHLRQVQKQDTIGRLAGGIAHDINNLLTPMMMHADLALTQDVPEPVREHLTGILDASHHARELVQQILTFARPSPPERARFDLSKVIGEAVSLARVSAPPGVAIETAVPERLEMAGDAGQIRQTLVNLCTNAVKALQGGSPPSGRVRVKAERLHDEGAETESGRHIRIEVADDGPGIPPEILDRVFDPFFTTRPRGEGTGLGLAVARGIVTEHEGTIVVDSTVGEGTVFEVLLPLGLQAVEAEEPGRVAAEPSREHGRLTILCVDDDILVSRTLRLCLQRLGHDVSSEERAATAVELVAAAPERFDIVFSDVNMAETTGVQLLEQLRAIRADLPVVLMTGYSDSVDADHARALGAAAFLQKPFSLDVLTSTIAQVVAASRAE